MEKALEALRAKVEKLELKIIDLETINYKQKLELREKELDITKLKEELKVYSNWVSHRLEEKREQEKSQQEESQKESLKAYGKELQAAFDAKGEKDEF
ncbi:hypothetical protein [Helicobacter sp. 11S02629-2]|uniref:hypothetical protein n=1 Tax=Helicobacter sp. 11S02629-2 TaxID=1476195 RepID=UPI000BA75CAB|nr:hypothetical protein [Helicobacter sp. 11S02629-2]PAF42739.1 hypothetical protein BKH40_07540 [Helicobacter sp. 11S02629-2]